MRDQRNISSASNSSGSRFPHSPPHSPQSKFAHLPQSTYAHISHPAFPISIRLELEAEDTAFGACVQMEVEEGGNVESAESGDDASDIAASGDAASGDDASGDDVSGDDVSVDDVCGDGLCGDDGRCSDDGDDGVDRLSALAELLDAVNVGETEDLARDWCEENQIVSLTQLLDSGREDEMCAALFLKAAKEKALRKKLAGLAWEHRQAKVSYSHLPYSHLSPYVTTSFPYVSPDASSYFHRQALERCQALEIDTSAKDTSASDADAHDATANAAGKTSGGGGGGADRAEVVDGGDVENMMGGDKNDDDASDGEGALNDMSGEPSEVGAGEAADCAARAHAKRRAKHKGAQAAVETSSEMLHCGVCAQQFASRNQLFKHIQSTGHAVPLQQPAARSARAKNASRRVR